jgi:hypothetical protein
MGGTTSVGEKVIINNDDDYCEYTIKHIEKFINIIEYGEKIYEDFKSNFFTRNGNIKSCVFTNINIDNIDDIKKISNILTTLNTNIYKNISTYDKYMINDFKLFKNKLLDYLKNYLEQNKNKKNLFTGMFTVSFGADLDNNETFSEYFNLLDIKIMNEIIFNKINDDTDDIFDYVILHIDDIAVVSKFLNLGVDKENLENWEKIISNVYTKITEPTFIKKLLNKNYVDLRKYGSILYNICVFLGKNVEKEQDKINDITTKILVEKVNNIPLSGKTVSGKLISESKIPIQEEQKEQFGKRKGKKKGKRSKKIKQQRQRKKSRRRRSKKERKRELESLWNFQ